MKSINRRNFLRTGLAASAFGVAPFNILKAGPSPNSKVNIACIGVGNQGGIEADLLARADNVNLVGLCDVDEAWYKRRNGGRKNLQKIKLWKDYRVMFDKIGKEYRRGLYRDARPRAFCRVDVRHEAGQARLCPKAALSHGQRGPHPDRRGP